MFWYDWEACDAKHLKWQMRKQKNTKRKYFNTLWVWLTLPMSKISVVLQVTVERPIILIAVNWD